MKIFGVDFGSDNTPKITEDDRLWVEENFRWLKTVFGYPNKTEKQVLITAEFFPVTFTAPSITVENIITDLCEQLGISRDAVRFQLLTDLRDSSNIPYQIEGTPFECETDLQKGDYTIFVANSLQQHPERLIHSLIYEFIRIRLTESDLEFDVGGDDTGLFIYLAGIYYGYGIILAQNLLHQGRSSSGLWEIKWNYISQMPQPVMAFSLATYANLVGDHDPEWKNEFKGDFRKMLEESLAYLKENPTDLYDEMEIKANDLFNEANEQFDNRDLEGAIATLQKILFLTNDDTMKADVLNNMGYYYMRTKDYPLAISNFRKALLVGPNYGYANDNLGYALLLMGELDEGLSYLHRALQTGNNDIAYSHRNFALYHQLRNETILAEEYFQKSLNEKTPVDLLEYHYGEFLLEQGDIEKAKLYFTKSADKKEEEGINKLLTL